MVGLLAPLAPCPLSPLLLPDDNHFVTDFTKPRMETKQNIIKDDVLCSHKFRRMASLLSQLSFCTFEVSSLCINNLPSPVATPAEENNHILSSQTQLTGQKNSLNCHLYYFIKIVFYQNILLGKSFCEALGKQNYILDTVPTLSGLTINWENTC